METPYHAVMKAARGDQEAFPYSIDLTGIQYQSPVVADALAERPTHAGAHLVYAHAVSGAVIQRGR